MVLINFLMKFSNEKSRFIFLFPLIIFLPTIQQINSNFLQSIQTKTSLIQNDYFSSTEINDERSQGANQNCLLIKNNILYDLFDLSNKTRNIELPEGTIIYQFCKNIENFNSPIIYNKTETNTVIKLSGSVFGETNNKNKIVVNEIEKTVTLLLSRGDKCKHNETEFYKFNIILTCDNSFVFEFENINENKNECNFILRAKTKFACGNSDAYFIPEISETKYRILIGIIVCLFGIILGVLSYKFLDYAIYLVCMAAFPFLFKYFLDLFTSNKNQIIFYIVIGTGIIIGAVVAFLLTMKKKFIKIYMCIIGGVLGFLIARLLYDVVIFLIETEYQKIIYYSILSVCILVGIISGIFFARLTCIVGTSTLGGYVLMRGISLFLKGIVDYIDENKIFYYAKTGNYEQIEEEIKPLFYIYPAMWVIFIISFTTIQHKINPKQDDCDDYKDLESKFEKSKLFPEDDPYLERNTEN